MKGVVKKQAERVGFEPTAEFKAQHSLSRRAQSATLAPPQIVNPVPPLAEGEGFEPPVGCPTPVFKTGTIGLSVIPPGVPILSWFSP